MMQEKQFFALSIRQPWADLKIQSKKDIETRTWKTNFRVSLVHIENQIKNHVR